MIDESKPITVGQKFNVSAAARKEIGAIKIISKLDNVEVIE